MQNRILLIDDDELILNSLECFLADEHYIIQSHDRIEGLGAIISSFDPNLIILDIKLHNADGREVCDELKNSPETANIPIILLTALSFEEISMIECEADAIIGKSYPGHGLLSTIRSLIAAIEKA